MSAKPESSTKPRSVSSWLMVATLALVVSLVVSPLTACGPAPQSNVMVSSNKTGFKDADGKSYTGSGSPKDLERVQRELERTETSPPATGESATPNGSTPPPPARAQTDLDRALAEKITGVRIVTSKLGEIPEYQVEVSLNDPSETVVFQFSQKDSVQSKPEDDPREVRYKSVSGLKAGGVKSNFLLSTLCLRPPASESNRDACRRVTMTLTTTEGARAGLLARHLEKSVLVKAPMQPKHVLLKRLAQEYVAPRAASFQSFEVRNGRSGFRLLIGDRELCPSGRLVETNDQDEPLKLNCPGIPSPNGLEGRMLGNTERGELIIEIDATTPGIAFGSNEEHIYIIVRQKSVAKAAVSQAPSAAKPPALAAPAPAPAPVPAQSPAPAAPGPKPLTLPAPAPRPPVAPRTNNANNTSSAPAPAPSEDKSDDDDSSDDDIVFQEDRREELGTSSAQTARGAVSLSGWLIPVDLNHPVSRQWAHDRNRPEIVESVNTWKNSDRLINFAQHFIPNRELVTKALARSLVPPEFAFIMMIESEFFIRDGYPVQGPANSTAWGPWQMLDGTAIGNGLQISRRLVGGRIVRGSICDQRAHLQLATEGAGRELKKLIRSFPQDPRLAVFAYNQGLLGPANQVASLKQKSPNERLRTFREINLTYWGIQKFNMGKKAGFEYVKKFMGIYHAALEMTPVRPDSSIRPWASNPRCS